MDTVINIWVLTAIIFVAVSTSFALLIVVAFNFIYKRQEISRLKNIDLAHLASIENNLHKAEQYYVKLYELNSAALVLIIVKFLRQRSKLVLAVLNSRRVVRAVKEDQSSFFSYMLLPYEWF